jgi:hypothetical protein
MKKLKFKSFLIIAVIHFVICSVLLYLNYINWIFTTLSASENIYNPIFNNSLKILTFPIRNIIDYFHHINNHGLGGEYGLLMLLMSSILWGLLFGGLKLSHIGYSHWLYKHIHVLNRFRQ